MIEFPEDLPWLIEWRLSIGGKWVETRNWKTGQVTRHLTETVVTHSLPRRCVHYTGSSGTTDAAVVKPQIPYGCTGWRLPGEREFRPLSALPRHWLPFVNRERETELDPRVCPLKAEARAEQIKRRAVAERDATEAAAQAEYERLQSEV